MNIVVEPEIDWAYEWRVVRWRRLSVSRSAKKSVSLKIVWCNPCKRLVLSFSFGRFYGSINCRDTRQQFPPPTTTASTCEWPEWVGSDLEFFDEFTEIVG